MSEFKGPVPMPALDAVAPEIYRGFYGMPMFVTVRTVDLESSKDFWIRGLGFIDLFSAPGQVVHLRRWAFQDVLLVPAVQVDEASAMSISFACVPSQIDKVAARCEEFAPGSTSEPLTTSPGSTGYSSIANSASRSPRSRNCSTTPT